MSDDQEPEYVDRARNPSKYPFIENRDEKGNVVSLSTHRMSAEVDKDGNWFAFPNIVMLPGGELHEFKDVRQAMRWNQATGNFKAFGKDGDSAQKYAKDGYKTKAMRDFDPLNFRGKK